jgi:hypothetical protein
MNPEMKARIAAGGFARITLDDDTVFTGYLAADPAQPSQLRMDGCVLGPSGHLEQISIRLEFDDIRHIQFLPEPPEFIDAEGHSYQMPLGFFRHLD